MADEIKTLEDFGGWEDTGTEDLFQEVPETPNSNSTEVEDILKEVAEDTPPIVPKIETPAEVVVVEESDDFFKTIDEEEKAEVKEKVIKEEEEEVVTTTGYIGTLSNLSSKGFIEYELEEGEELTEERAEELLEDGFDTAIETRVKDLFEDMPEVVKQLNKYVINGGDAGKFFQAIAKTNSVGISSDMDLDDEANQELVTRKMLTQEGFDEDYINVQIEFLKDSKKLDFVSKKKFEVWKKANEASQAALIASQEAASKKRKEDLRDAKKKTTTYLADNTQIGQISISKKAKKELPSYMNDNSVKLQNGSSISQFQKELFYDLPKNSEAFMQLALLMKNRNEDGTFNFDSITKKAKTKAIKDVKDNIRRTGNQPPNSTKTSKQTSEPKHLADYF